MKGGFVGSVNKKVEVLEWNGIIKIAGIGIFKYCIFNLIFRWILVKLIINVNRKFVYWIISEE